MRKALVAAVLALIVAGCSTVAPGGSAVDENGRKLQEQSFQPPYPAAPPAGRRFVRIDRATLDDAHTSLTVQFVGSRGYLESDGCSDDYAPWVGQTPDRLDVAIVEVEHIRVTTGGGCTLEGHGYTFHLALAARYDGVQVVDRGGGQLFVGPPSDVATLTLHPAGWAMRRGAQECCGGEPPIWFQVYAADEVAEPPFEGPGRLVLYQAFGIISEWDDTRAVKSESRGGHAESVTFRGQPTKVWVDPASGELLLAWTDGGRSYGLIGNAADMTTADLVRFAEGVRVAGG